MDPQFKYRAFISYSHRDEEWAKWLHRSLETYRIPKHLVGRETEYGDVPERLAPVFRDRDELPTATNLGETLTRALQQSACQIVICSPAAAKSHWVNEEILAFKRLGREHRIFALIVGGEPGLLRIASHGRRGVLSEGADLQDRRGRPADDREANRSPRTPGRARTASWMPGSSWSPACWASASTN